MKKVIILLFIIISTAAFAKKVNFTVVYTGNFNGEYSQLPSIYSYIKGLEQEHREIIKIDGGNNLTGVETTDRNFYDYLKKSQYQFYLLGGKEIKASAFIKNEIKYSSVNIEQANVIPYETTKIDDFAVAVVGISDVYSATFDGLKIYDYRNELNKLLLKLDEICDFIFVVSELRRDENLDILKNYKNIAAVFESGKTYNDKEIIKLGQSWLIPNDKLVYIDFAYNKEGAALMNRYREEYRIKSLSIESSKNISEITFYQQDAELTKKQLWQKSKAEKLDKEIIGENYEEFKIQEIPLGGKIAFIDDVAAKLRRFYNADLAIIPAKVFKKGLKKGFYSKAELDGVFSKEKIIKFKMTAKDLAKLYEVSIGNMGMQSFLYFFQAGEREKKNEFTVVSTENIFEDYEKFNYFDTEIKKIDLTQFASEVVQ